MCIYIYIYIYIYEYSGKHRGDLFAKVPLVLFPSRTFFKLLVDGLVIWGKRSLRAYCTARSFSKRAAGSKHRRRPEGCLKKTHSSRERYSILQGISWFPYYIDITNILDKTFHRYYKDVGKDVPAQNQIKG